MESKIKRLERIDLINRAKSARYMERKRKQGKQPISAILSADAYKTLQELKEAAKQAGEPCTTGDIVGEGLKCLSERCE